VGDHDLVEKLGLEPVGGDEHALRPARDRAHRRSGEEAAVELLEQPLDVHARTASDRLPLRPARELELTVVFEELGQEPERELPDCLRVG
jgi:hypothetical protein